MRNRPPVLPRTVCHFWGTNRHLRPAAISYSAPPRHRRRIRPVVRNLDFVLGLRSNNLNKRTDIAGSTLKGMVLGHVQRWRLFVLLPLLLVAVGCGGGGGGDTGEAEQPTGTPPPTGGAMPDNLVAQWQTTLTYVPG